MHVDISVWSYIRPGLSAVESAILRRETTRNRVVWDCVQDNRGSVRKGVVNDQ